MTAVSLAQALDEDKLDHAVHALLLLLGEPLSASQLRRFATMERAVAKASELLALQRTVALQPGLAPADQETALSYSQLQMFTLQTLAPQSTAYNIVRAVRVSRSVPFDATALHATCAALLAKHAVLRTVFPTNTYREPRQCVQPLSHFNPCKARHGLIEVAEVDQSIFASDESLANRIAATTSKPFDLSCDAPIRFYAITCAQLPSEWALAVVMHHIVTDPESSSVFWRDFEYFYTKFQQETPQNELLQDELLRLEREASATVSYRDYSYWQRLRLQSGLLAESLQYWIGQLSGEEIPQLELPFDRQIQPGSRDGGRPGKTVVFQSTPELQQSFSGLCASQGVSMFIGALAIFQMLISRVANCDDIVIGAPTAGRSHEKLAGLMGYFVCTLPFRIKAKDRGDFADFLLSVKDVVVSGFSHMDVPLQKILEHVHFDRTTSRNPLFQVMFAWENGSSPEEDSAMVMADLELPHETAKFDLMLSMRYGQNAAGQKVLEGTFEYPVDAFDRSTIERFGQYFLELVSQVTQQPKGVPLSDIQMIPAAERLQMLRGWGSPAVPLTTEKTPGFLDECLLKQVQRTPDNVALRFEGETWTYKHLWHRSSQVAAALHTHGATNQQLHGFRVGLFLDRGLDSIASIFGVLQVRAIFIPLDPEFPIDRIQYMLENSQAEVVITQRHLVSKLKDLLSRSSRHDFIRILVCEDTYDLDANHILRHDDMSPTHTTAYILFTSGSTGKPKGVMVSHANLLTTLKWTVREYDVVPEDIFLQSTSSTLDGSLTQLFSPLIAGASALITKKNGLHDLNYISGLITQHHVTLCVFVPSYFAMLIDFMGEFPQHVKHVVLAGEVFPTALASKFYKKHTRLCEVSKELVSPTCLVNEYGPTEASVTSTFFRFPCELARIRPEIKNLQSIPIGRGVDDHYLVVLDKYKRLVPVNVPGELYVGGRGVAQGYWGRADLTENSFHHEELAWLHTSGEIVEIKEELRWYKTGDLVKWLPCGELLFLGRADSQVKLRGMRIELQEVRNVLLQCAQVKDAEVLVVDQRLVAYAILASAFSSAKIEATKLREQLGCRLPVHMIPHEIIIVDAWPRTPNGKLDLRALAQVEAPTDETPTDQQHGDMHDVDSSKRPSFVVDILKQAWREVLKVNDDPALMRGSFFELGGNSLSAIRVISLVKPHGIALKLESFFKCRNLLEMASACVSTLAAEVCSQQKNTMISLNWKPWTDSSSPSDTSPLFLIHCADGTVWKMMELARRLPFPVYGLQATHGGKVGSVEELAAAYWEEIKAVQRVGPYRIGGFSFGCRIAHAVAVLGRQEGAIFRPLTLLDGVPFHYQDRRDRAQSKDASPEEPEDAEDNVTEYVARALGYKPGTQQPLDARDPERDLFDQLVTNYASHCHLDSLYRPCASLRKSEEPIEANLFKTSHWDVDAVAYRSLGVDMEVIPVEGQHLTMLRAPHVESVARAVVAAAQLGLST